MFGQAFALPAASAPENAVLTARHYQPELPLLGLALPCSIRETCRYGQQPETLCRTEEQAAALARLQSLQALYAAWPDTERIARKEDCTVNDGKLNYTVTYTVVSRYLRVNAKGPSHFRESPFAFCVLFVFCRLRVVLGEQVVQVVLVLAVAEVAHHLAGGVLVAHPFTSSLRPRLNSISLVRSALQSHW